MLTFLKKNYGWLTITLIFLLGLTAYFNVLHSPFQFDDENFIANNLSIRKLANFRALWFTGNTRYLTYLSFALNYRLNQLHVFGYHLFNLIIHIISAILVWRLTRLTFKTPLLYPEEISSYAKSISFFAGIIFLVHPVQTQGVTYIYQRSASLATLFYLAALTLYVKYRLTDYAGDTSRNRALYYNSSLFITALAMFTKETAFTLPFMILLYDLCFLKKQGWTYWLRTAPFLITLAIIPITIMLHARSVNVTVIHRALEKGASINTWDYLLTQPKVIATYIRLAFLPINQNLDYDYPIAKTLFSVPVISSVLFLSTILIAALRIFNKYRLLSFSIFWFFLTLIPESSIVPIRDVIFEHRLYLPLVGYTIFLVSGIYYLCFARKTKFAVIILTSITICYAIMTYNRNLVWQDKLALWNDTVKKSPKKARPYNNRGLAYYTQGNLSEAIADYTKAIEIDPEYAQAYSNRGLAYYDKGKLGEAILDHSRAIKINPRSAEAYNNRGLARYDKDEYDKAVLDYTYAIDINPYYFEAFSNLGNIFRNSGNTKQAIICYNRAIQINPSYAAAYYNRGIVYYNEGKFKDAVADYTAAINITPKLAQAYNNRGLAYYKNGNREQALIDWGKAIKINPRLAEAYNNRGLAYFFNQDYELAQQDFSKAGVLGYQVQGNILKDLKKGLKK